MDFSVERDTLGGILRPMAGIQVAYYYCYYTGDTHAMYLLTIDRCTRAFSLRRAGRIKGFNGGWDNSIRLGLTRTTRRLAPNRFFFGRGHRTQLWPKPSARSTLYGQFKL